MKQFFLLIWTLFTATLTWAGSGVQVERNQKWPVKAVLSMSRNEVPDLNPHLETIRLMPAPASETGNQKSVLMDLRRSQAPSPSSGIRSSSLPEPLVGRNFAGLNANGSPNDNHVAISDSGKVVSVLNTSIRIFSDTGQMIRLRSLTNFVSSLGLFINNSDPRVLFDPMAKRFILLFFSGNTSATSKILIAFSQTQDPDGDWNFYELPGCYLNDTTWSDYPIVSVGKNDVFLTFNHLKDGEGWQTGFRYSAIWQIDKQTGYNGDSLEFNFWHHMAHQGKPLWSVCPVQEDLSLPAPGNDAYLLSVRPSAVQNDTLFVHYLSNSVASGNAAYSLEVYRTATAYGLPPNALQGNNNWLATNDARVLSAARATVPGFADVIHYVQNSRLTGSTRSGIFRGMLNLQTNSCEGMLIDGDTLDLAYPSITVAGQTHKTILLTASAVSETAFPGTVVMSTEAFGTRISKPVWVKKGEGFINTFADSIERWGDYTGIQTKFNQLQTVWLSGSYGFTNGQYRTWIAEVVSNDTLATGVPTMNFDKTLVFPVPTQDRLSINFQSPTSVVSIYLYDLNGKEVMKVFEQAVSEGEHQFTFQVEALAPGIYFMGGLDAGGNRLFYQKVVKQ